MKLVHATATATTSTAIIIMIIILTYYVTSQLELVAVTRMLAYKPFEYHSF